MDTNDDGKTGLGDHIMYTITVENNGNVPLTDIKLVDTPTDMTGGPLTLSSPPEWVSGGSPDKLAVGEVATYKASFVVNHQAATAGGISNTVTGTGSSPGKEGDVTDVSDDGEPSDGDGDGDPGNDPTIVETEKPEPSIEVIKK